MGSTWTTLTFDTLYYSATYAHIAFVRKSGILSVYVNGVKFPTTFDLTGVSFYRSSGELFGGGGDGYWSG